jgi:phosphate-selective porin OprO/OprP
LRFSLEYAQSSFKGGCSTGALNAPVNPGCLTGLVYAYQDSSKVIDRPDEKIIMQRFQLTF